MSDRLPNSVFDSESVALPYAPSIIKTLTQGKCLGALARRVASLALPEFIGFLDFITAEFQQFLRAIDLINDETLENMLEQLLDTFTLKIGEVLQVERTTIFFVDEEKGQLWSRVNQDGQKRQEIRFAGDTGILGRVVATGQGMNLVDAYNHPLFNPQVDEREGCTIQTLLCMPIFSSKEPEKVVAVVQLINKEGDTPFDEADEKQFQDLAGPLALILESCQSLYNAGRNQRGVSALLQATTSLGQSLDLEMTLQAVMDQARNLLNADRSTVFLLRKETGDLWTKVATADGKTMMEISIPANRGLAGYVASTGQSLNIPDAYQDPRFDPSTDRRTGYVTRNILCMPVFNSAGELIGVTQLINKDNGSFTTSDEFFMQAFNIQAGIAIENAKLFENVNLEKQYQKDILQSLSDAVISTDMKGNIVTINEAALELLGCPIGTKNKPESEAETDDFQKTSVQHLWESKLIGRPIWEVIPLESLQFRLEDSLKNSTRQYVPEQNLTISLYADDPNSEERRVEQMSCLALRDRANPEIYLLWGEPPTDSGETDKPPAKILTSEQLQHIERSINLTVTPLTNPQGDVRGGLVVLEDISREKRMKNAMYRYMNPEVAERVMALGEDSLMVGERKEVTVLFSDIRGYTTMTENRGASEVVTLLNQYFETMVEAVFAHEGTLDKFIGDALMAVFGAPLPLTENHAWLAVKSALDMRQRLKQFNQKRIIGAQPLKVGIGISSGEVVSGNIGSQKRMDYTVIGDAVNLSARLESVTKEYGCDIILSQTTYDLCGDRLWVRELDKIRVKGKNEAVSIYELIGDRSEPLTPSQVEFLNLYAVGRSQYIDREFDRALVTFEAAHQLRPNDRAIAVHLERCRAYLTAPPPASWDGVHIMMTK
ncbi:MAG: adenylate/guanylate cyclase domain-containing protein [Cyanobacteria bacterium J055]|nr:MAG: adenylate/guanylate cyclase domain-containing protein [Cyanobacteria bacterium J055]